MADNFQLNLGSLRSSVNLTLHTHHASRLWFGRQRTEGKPGMIGLSGFANILNRIKRGCEQDDPYSDWFLILIEEKIDNSEQEMKDIDNRLDEVMAVLPAMLSIGENLSVQPVTLPLFLSTPLAFKAVYLLTAYDELVRRILLAGHVGLIDNNAKGQWLDEGAAILRRLFGLSQRYKYSGASGGILQPRMHAPSKLAKCMQRLAKSRRTSSKAHSDPSLPQPSPLHQTVQRTTSERTASTMP
ncbi:hypothetical protein PSA5_06445 [Pseudomonas syringae pv. actinidiae]|nr:hypothetical protein PSA5_06445 [Pseudomonas syringae pv. actinidiae]